VRYCSHCILPDTRPGIELGPDGVCSACRSHGRRGTVDWASRREQFDRAVADAKAKSRRYDCVIPVSGGKDSTWQVVTCLEAGLHPLAVTWRPPGRTRLGELNLRNLIELGVDHLDVSVNPRVERLFALRSFERYGTNAIPMHLAIFNVPLAVAVRFGIPLVVWGEDSSVEYVGTDDGTSFRLDRDWVRRYGAVHGTTAADWVSDELTVRDLVPYAGPSDEELAASGVEGVFLGYFFPWDPSLTAEVASAHGFRARDEGPHTGYYEYADIDDEFISIHHWMKWFKFGFTRTYDNLSLEIRNGRLSRGEAIAILAERGDETPHPDIESFCEWVGISRAQFFETAERFRNPDVWTRRDGVWVIDGFLVDDWQWQEGHDAVSPRPGRG